jgi:hypothetical protein
VTHSAISATKSQVEAVSEGQTASNGINRIAVSLLDKPFAFEWLARPRFVAELD